MIVNVGDIDFVSSEGDYCQLLDRINVLRDGEVRSGRYYYNPMPYHLT